MPLWGRGISSLYRRSVFKNLNKTVHTLVLIFNLPENVQIHCIQSVMHSLHPDFIRRCILLYLSFFFPFHRGIWILFAYLKCVNPYSLFKCQLNTFIITRITTKQRSMGCVLAILVCVGIIIPPPPSPFKHQVDNSLGIIIPSRYCESEGYILSYCERNNTIYLMYVIIIWSKTVWRRNKYINYLK